MSVDECPSFGNQELEDGQCSLCFNNPEKKELCKACGIETRKNDREPHPTETQDLPKRYYNELGHMKIIKGRDHSDTKQIISWETVRMCRGEHCPAYDLCEYNVKEHSAERLKCRVETTYLRSIASIIYRNFISVLDEPTLTRVGMHLMPIYQNLCRLKIAEVGVATPVETDEKGRTYINPVYKEMREHIKLLEQTWRSIGLTEYFIEVGLDAGIDVDIELGKEREEAKGKSGKKKIVRRRAG